MYLIGCSTVQCMTSKVQIDNKMAKTRYLKESYQKRLWIVVVINTVIFWGFVVLHADFSSIWTSISSISFNTGIAGLIAPTVVFLLDGLLSADTKARVIFWRFSHPLPGSRAFSIHLKNETRADPDQLVNRWGVLPDDPAEQNRLWYRIFRDVENEVRVYEAHRGWLIARDLTGFSFLFLVIFGTATLISDVPWTTASFYLSILAVQYLATMITARNLGIRFVRTVLAVASQNRQQN